MNFTSYSFSITQLPCMGENYSNIILSSDKLNDMTSKLIIIHLYF